MKDLIGIINADSRKSVSKFSGWRWLFALKIYTMERDIYKQTKLAKTLEFKLKKVTSELQSIYLISYVL